MIDINYIGINKIDLKLIIYYYSVQILLLCTEIVAFEWNKSFNMPTSIANDNYKLNIPFCKIHTAIIAYAWYFL